MGGHPKWKQRDMDDAQGASPAGKEQALWAAAEVLSQGCRTSQNCRGWWGSGRTSQAHRGEGCKGLLYIRREGHSEAVSFDSK